MQESLREEAAAGDAAPRSGAAHRARGHGAGCRATRGTAGTRQGTRLEPEPTGARAPHGTPPLGQAPPPAVAVPWSPRGHPVVVPWSPRGHIVPARRWQRLSLSPSYGFTQTLHGTARSLTPSPLRSAGVPQTPPGPCGSPNRHRAPSSPRCISPAAHGGSLQGVNCSLRGWLWAGRPQVCSPRLNYSEHN